MRVTDRQTDGQQHVACSAYKLSHSKAKQLFRSVCYAFHTKHQKLSSHINQSNRKLIQWLTNKQFNLFVL